MARLPDQQLVDQELSAADAFALTKVCSVGGLLGESVEMQRLFEQLARAATMRVDVLMIGEPGSGKELAARCLHELSARSAEPFLVLNCGAPAAGRIEAELFGCDAGAASEDGVAHFTSERGHLERAGRGTVLLEEIGELPPEMQLRLLRALESRRIVPVGGSREIEIHCRVVATIQPDSKASRSASVLPDLLDRLSVCPVFVPALRDRRGDAELLARYFLAVLNAEEGTSRRLSDASIECLERYSWPGNVRELRNAVHRAFILADGDLDLSVAIDRPLPLSSNGDTPILRIPVGTPLAEAERWMIVATLRKCEGNKTRAAALLGVSLKTLYNRLHAYRAQGFDMSDTDPAFIEVAN